MTGLYQGRLPFIVGSDTSEGAANSMEGSVTALRKAVLDAIKSSHDGATCDQIELKLQLSHQTTSARVRELALMGMIEDTGVRRPTRSGRYARVYVSTQARAA